MKFTRGIALLLSFITFISFASAAPVPNKYRDTENKYQRYIFLLKNESPEHKLEESQVNEVVTKLQDYISHVLGGDIIFDYNIIDGFSFDIIKQQQTKNGDLQHQFNLLATYVGKELSEYEFILEKDLVIY